MNIKKVVSLIYDLENKIVLNLKEGGESTNDVSYFIRVKLEEGQSQKIDIGIENFVDNKSVKTEMLSQEEKKNAVVKKLEELEILGFDISDVLDHNGEPFVADREAKFAPERYQEYRKAHMGDKWVEQAQGEPETPAHEEGAPVLENDDAPQNFFDQIKAQDIRPLILDAVSKGSFHYNTLVYDRNVAHATGRSSDADRDHFTRNVYGRWFDLMKLYKEKLLDDSGSTYATDHPESAKFIDLVNSEKVFEPEEVEKVGYHKFLTDLVHWDSQVMEKYPGVEVEFPPALSQDTFLHFKSHYYNGGKSVISGNIDCRFYLNLRAENIAKFCNNFSGKCQNANIDSYFKTEFNDYRADSIIIYSTYKDEHHKKTLAVLRELKQEMPELFIGADKIVATNGIIDDFLGFGEEPTKEGRHSFNSIRADAIGEVVEDINKKEIIPFLQNKILDENARVHDGENMVNMKEVITNFLRINLPIVLAEMVEKDEKNLKDAYYRRLYIDDNPKLEDQINDEIVLLKEYISRFQNNDAEDIISIAMDKVVKSVSGGEIPNYVSINMEGLHHIRLNIDAKLRQIFEPEIENIVQANLSDEKISEVFAKYDISLNKPHLNLSTEMKMAQGQGDEVGDEPKTPTPEVAIETPEMRAELLSQLEVSIARDELLIEKLGKNETQMMADNGFSDDGSQTWSGDDFDQIDFEINAIKWVQRHKNLVHERLTTEADYTVELASEYIDGISERYNEEFKSKFKFIQSRTGAEKRTQAQQVKDSLQAKQDAIKDASQRIEITDETVTEYVKETVPAVKESIAEQEFNNINRIRKAHSMDELDR